jgi:hypothetical protein
MPFAPETLDGFRGPSYLKSVPDRIGTTFGKWAIVGVTHRPGTGGAPDRCWVVRCACGTERLILTRHFGKPGGRDAEQCLACTIRERSDAVAARYGGKTVAELAREAGVTTKAIRRRIRLGWRSDQLGLPRGAHRAPNDGPRAQRSAA